MIFLEACYDIHCVFYCTDFLGNPHLHLVLRNSHRNLDHQELYLDVLCKRHFLDCELYF